MRRGLLSETTVEILQKIQNHIFLSWKSNENEAKTIRKLAGIIPCRVLLASLAAATNIQRCYKAGSAGALASEGGKRQWVRLECFSAALVAFHDQLAAPRPPYWCE
jgi:hypothetical protein